MHRAQAVTFTGTQALDLGCPPSSFTALGKETDQSFADAIVQDATMEMSRMRGSLVIAWSTAASYRGKAMDPKQIGRDLGVRYVVEGSVQRAGNHVEINAQLIDAGTDSHLSVAHFDIELGDLITVQNEIASRLRHTLGRQMVLNEVERAERNHTPLDAVDYVLRGDVLFDHEGSKDRYRHQQEMFERALQLDPGLPLAKLKLADMLSDKVVDLCPPCDAPEADLRRATTWPRRSSPTIQTI